MKDSIATTKKFTFLSVCFFCVVGLISAHATVVVASAACGEHVQQENEKPRLFS